MTIQQKTNQEKTHTSRTQIAALLPALGPAAFLLAAFAHAEGKIEPRIGAVVTYVDNINLVSDGETKTSDWVVELRPGINATIDTQRFTANLDYELREQRTLGEDDRNQRYQTLVSGARLTAIRDLLDFHGHATYTQSLINPTRAINIEQLFDVGNVVDAFVYGGGADIYHEFGDKVLKATYDRTDVNYQHADDLDDALVEDSENQNAMISFGSDPRQERRFGWETKYEWTDVNYELSGRYRHESATLGGSVELSRGWAVVGEGGRESNVVESTEEGGLNSTRWNAGLRWKGNRDNAFEVRAGKRFDKTSYLGSISRRARQLTLNLRYSEEPTTESEATGRRASSPLPDPTFPPPTTGGGGIGLDRPTAEVFINKEFRGGAKLTGARSEIEIYAYQQRREYLLNQGTDRSTGAAVDASRRLSARAKLNARANTESITSRDGLKLRYWLVGVEYEREITRTAHFSIELLHLEQDTPTGKPKANAASLKFNKTF